MNSVYDSVTNSFLNAEDYKCWRFRPIKKSVYNGGHTFEVKYGWAVYYNGSNLENDELPPSYYKGKPVLSFENYYYGYFHRNPKVKVNIIKFDNTKYERYCQFFGLLNNVKARVIDLSSCNHHIFTTLVIDKYEPFDVLAISYDTLHEIVYSGLIGKSIFIEGVACDSIRLYNKVLDEIVPRCKQLKLDTMRIIDINNIDLYLQKCELIGIEPRKMLLIKE